MASTLYDSLPLGVGQIRLLHLSGGDLNEPIQGELVVASLNEDPRYEALSYFWGSPDNRKSITINSYSVLITKNLYDALLRLRLHGSTRVLWIDALCINQDDHNEKASQVSMMDQIYCKTDLGILWLGEEPEVPAPSVNQEINNEISKLLGEAKDLLKDIGPYLQAYEQNTTDDPNIMLPEISGDPQHEEFVIGKTIEIDWTATDSELMSFLMQDPERATDGIFHAICLLRMLEQHHHLDEIPYLFTTPNDRNTLSLAGRHGLAYLLQLPWFNRIWTVQECILPPSCVVMYGPCRAAWTTFLRATENFKTHRSSCCAHVSGVNSVLQPLIDTLGHMSEFTQAQKFGAEVPLDALVHRFRGRDATKPRDKIYGLLPLVTEWYDHEPIKPDYNETTTTAQVYTRTVLRMIEISRTFDILSQPGHYKRAVSSALPTWVPDFEHKISRVENEIFNQNASLYAACGSTSASVSAIDEKVLVLECRNIGYIREASTRMLSLNDAFRKEVFLDWYTFIEKQPQGQKPDSVEQQFWRTLCGDCVAEEPIRSFGAGHAITSTFRRAEQDDENTFREWCYFYNLEALLKQAQSKFRGMEGSDSSRSIGRIDSAIRTTTTGRRLFLSENGDLGLAPSHAALSHSKPDEIFVIPGAKCPFILRPVGVREVSGKGQVKVYEMVGECFLHGFMDGEGMVNFEKDHQTVYVV